MSFVLNTFSSLCETYPTWEVLSAYLQSEAGGKLRIISYPAEQKSIVRYVKGVSDMSLAHVRMFRSVVWDTVKNRPICVAPVKAEPRQDAIPEGSYWVSEFVDGVMMNVFRDASGQTQIVTRTNLGAHNRFYGDRSFAELFKEATPNTISWDNILQPNQFLSVVIQHPEHTTVANFRQCRIYVTQVGEVEANGKIKIHISPDFWPTTIRGFAPFNYSNYCIEAPPVFRSYKFKGYVVQTTNMYTRFRIVNPDYEKVRALIGNESNVAQRFLRLRKEGKVKEYLTYFHEQSKEMWEFEQTFRQKTHELYEAYCEVNKTKTKTMKDIPIPFRTHVYELQGEYLKSLPKPGQDIKPVPIRKETVIARVNGLTPEEQLKVFEA
jgi:hypothetical protein